MPRYRVTLEGILRETWTVDADTPDDAIESVRNGEGEWVEAEWVGDPDAVIKNGGSG